jgi:YHS domain-containing protein
MFKKLAVLIALPLCFLSCSESSHKTEPAAEGHEVKTSATDPHPYKNLKFDSDKDFICGMPVSAGVTDTVQYKGKIYGFCSAECKVEFAKNPDSYLTGK